MRRLLLDQGIPRSARLVLSEAGWDVLHAAEVGMSRAADREILDWCRTEHRVCVTLDADFHALLATSGESRPSVIRIRREGLDGHAMGRLLEAIWPRIETALAAGAMVTVTDRTVRLRPLPVARNRP